MAMKMKIKALIFIQLKRDVIYQEMESKQRL